MQALQNIKGFFLNRANTIAFVLAIAGAVMLIPPVFELPLGALPAENYMINSLDGSWILGLNYAKNLNLTWGTEFEFTYGPLFYLSTRFGWGCSKYAFIIYDLFYFANLFAVFFISYKRSSNRLLSAIIIIAAMLLTPEYIGGGNALVWSLLLIFWLRQNMEKPHWAYYILQSIILCMLFYLKFNTGLISFVLYYASLSYIFMFKKDRRALVFLYAVLPLALAILLAYYFNVSLPGYIVSGFNMVSGYNEIMYIEDPNTGEMRLMAIIYILLLCGLLVAMFFGKKGIFSRREELYKGLVIIFITGTGLFVIYKQAFVRADPGHMMEFFKCCTLLVVCISLFQGTERKKWALPLVILLFVPIIYASARIGHGNVIAFENKINKSGYFKGMADFTPVSGYRLHPNTNQIPQSVKDRLGNNTADVFPWNVYMMLENKLNYLPRPVMQSYVTYTKYLEDQNFDHYNSARAPEFVLYSYEGMNLDNRYCFFDEPKLQLVLLKNYTQVDAFDLNGNHILVLQKKKDIQPVKLELIKEYAMLIDSPIVPKEGIYYEIELYKTLGAKIESVLTYSPPLQLEVRNMKNASKLYKTSVPMLQTGIFGNTSLENIGDFENLMAKKNTDKERQVKFYRVRPSGDDFKGKMRIREYKII